MTNIITLNNKPAPSTAHRHRGKGFDDPPAIQACIIHHSPAQVSVKLHVPPCTLHTGALGVPMWLAAHVTAEQAPTEPVVAPPLQV